MTRSSVPTSLRHLAGGRGIHRFSTHRAWSCGLSRSKGSKMTRAATVTFLEWAMGCSQRTLAAAEEPTPEIPRTSQSNRPRHRHREVETNRALKPASRNAAGIQHGDARTGEV